MAAARSQRQEQRQLCLRMRSEGRTWVEIAELLRDQYGLNARVAFRLAHGWSQADAAGQWTRRWPGNPKTFKNFSYWELWPGASGHAPSLDVLSNLAELYSCSVSDLISDCDDFRTQDPAYRNAMQLSTLPSLVRSARDVTNIGEDAVMRDPAQTAADMLTRLDTMNSDELAEMAGNWIGRLGTDIDRRALLLKLSASLALAAGSLLVPPEAAATSTPLRATSDKLTGIWLSRYVYPSTGRAKSFMGQHYVVLRQDGSKVLGVSIPQTSGSQLHLDLTVKDLVATGSWREDTAPTGYYQGAAYHGTLQMTIDPSGRRMSGMWLGFGRDFTINSGNWDLRWQESSTKKSVQQSYENAV